MVIPRSRSRSMESSSWARMARGSTVCVISRMRSASVDFPWSMWAMIEKLRMRDWSVMGGGPRVRGSAAAAGPQPPLDERADLRHLGQARADHEERVRGPAREQRRAHGDDLRGERLPQPLVHALPHQAGD